MKYVIEQYARSGVTPHQLHKEQKLAKLENQQYLRHKIDSEGNVSAYIGTTRQGLAMLTRRIEKPRPGIYVTAWDSAALDRAIWDADDAAVRQKDELRVVKVTIGDARVNSTGGLYWDADLDQLQIAAVFDSTQLEDLQMDADLHEETRRILQIGSTALQG